MFIGVFFLSSCGSPRNTEEWIPVNQYNEILNEHNELVDENKGLLQRINLLEAQKDELIAENKEIQDEHQNLLQRIDRFEDQHRELFDTSRKFIGKIALLENQTGATKESLTNLQEEHGLLLERYEALLSTDENTFPQTSNEFEDLEAILAAITVVRFTFEGTIEDFKKLFDIELPPGALKEHGATRNWSAIGVTVETEFGDKKIVLPYDQAFDEVKDISDFEKFVTVTTFDQHYRLHDHPASISTLQELPGLDFVLLDLPADSTLIPIPLPPIPLDGE